jgi:hypothetical protein
MKRRALRLFVGLGAGALVILLARTIAYALAPSPTANVFAHQAGGPALPVLALVSLTLAAAVAVAICWLTAFGIRERVLLERRLLVEPVRSFDAGRTFALWLALSIVTSIGGGLFEAYIHWRAGLGWHGLDCIVGPVHRDLLPIETSLSLVAAAALAAAERVLAWMQRTVALLRAVSLCVTYSCAVFRPAGVTVPRRLTLLSAGAARAPPALS